MELKIKKVHPDAIIPTYATSGSSGMDLHCVSDFTIEAGRLKLIPTGLIITGLSEFKEIQIRPKSGLAAKYGITVLNTPGTIDSDYVGEIGVILYNTGNDPYSFNKGDKIAQAVVCPIYKAEFIEVSDFEDTERGSGGFGSTGR